MQLSGHRDLSRGEMPAGFFPGVEDHISRFKIHIIPRQAVDLP